jgi:uncharacterized membrane protein YphA (DoxX/SURF4 family)
VNAALRSIRGWLDQVAGAWNQFWFTPVPPHTLCLIRLLAGWMLFYTHLVWSKDLLAFLGPDSWVSPEMARQMHQGTTAWSYLWYVQSPVLLWVLHVLALVVMAMLFLGFKTRIAAVLAWLIAVAYCHRLTGALFGLDQVNTMLAMYLMLGPSGAAYSIDRWLARRRAGGTLPPPAPSVGANIAIRLIQLHMCVIYLFGGIGKMRGELWWDGFAMWYAAANWEYQSLDMTWLGYSPLLFSILTHATVFWETFYCVLVWPRLTRPIVLGMAVMVHGG